MLQPENQSKKYNSLFADIDTGKIKIPKFQRDFVWTKEQTAKLVDSIIKGFPIGTFIFWKTKDELRYIKEIGNIPLPDVPKGDSVSYVLDGQQRITSLYAVKKGLIISKDGTEFDYKDIYINLDSDVNDEEQVVTIEASESVSQISIYQLLNGYLTEFLDDFDKDELKKIEIYQKRLTGYDFSTIVISEYPIDIACEIFTRINTGGTELTLFEIMVAKTYDQEREFDLASEYDLLIDSGSDEKSLNDVGFETVPASVVIQSVSACLCKNIRRKDILKLDKTNFIDIWPSVKNCLFRSVDYIRTVLRIPVSRLLPYNILLVPLTYFFIKNNEQPPSHSQTQLLKQYIWWSAMTNRFTSAVESKISVDLKKIDEILVNQKPEYKQEELEVSLDDIRWRWFSTGDAFCKAILCLYCYFQPKSFASNGIVTIDNAWLKVTASKNYHHFFPKAYLKKTGFEDWKANSILNITIVDDYLNKKKIGAKPPSEYMGSFQNENKMISETMQTHLIDDLDKYGIWNDDFETFIEERGKRIHEELCSILNPGACS